MEESLNVLGETLKECGRDPITGFYRNACCDTETEDLGLHTVCARMTLDFLEFSKSRGNDLSTSRPEFGFDGLLLEIDGVFVQHVGKNPTNQGWHLMSSMNPPTRRHSKLLI